VIRRSVRFGWVAFHLHNRPATTAFLLPTTAVPPLVAWLLLLAARTQHPETALTG
jgi:hypothetical protein